VLRELLTVILGIGAMFVVLCMAGTVLTIRSLRKRNAVGRHRRAPLSWMWWPSRCARLHRRLVRADRMAASTSAATGSAERGAKRGRHHPLAPMVLEVRVRAEAVDVDLVRAALARNTVRRELLWDLDRRVADVEQLVMRLSTNAHRLARLTPDLPGMDPIEVRLDAFEAALRELEPALSPAQLEVERVSQPYR
jgi:hypothetical protein